MVLNFVWVVVVKCFRNGSLVNSMDKFVVNFGMVLF